MTKDKIRAAAALRPARPKRFYKAVTVGEAAAGFAVHLDGRPVKTPKRRHLALPSRRMAEAVAAEWAAQKEEIDPARMPLTQLASTAIDGVAEAVDACLDTLAEHARADLLCYRADYPHSLASAQAETWQPLLDWAESAFGVRLRVTVGVMAVEQPGESLSALRAAFARYDVWRLTAAQALAGAFGSVVLALAVIEGRIAAAEAYAVSRLDEIHQARVWGEDAEARRRIEAIGLEVCAAADFAGLA
jgi:chaperone required for assembly of F1-ATPase